NTYTPTSTPTITLTPLPTATPTLYTAFLGVVGNGTSPGTGNSVPILVTLPVPVTALLVIGDVTVDSDVGGSCTLSATDTAVPPNVYTPQLVSGVQSHTRTALIWSTITTALTISDTVTVTSNCPLVPNAK